MINYSYQTRRVLISLIILSVLFLMIRNSIKPSIAMQSENFQIPASSVDQGGQPSKSDNYNISADSIGSTGVLPQTSTTYREFAGAIPAEFYVLTMTSPAEVYLGNLSVSDGNNVGRNFNSAEKIYFDDSRWNGVGWSATAYSSALTDGGKTIANNFVYWSTGTITNIAPASSTGISTGASPGYLNQALTIANAGSSSGMGVYTIQPNVTVFFPPGVQPGNYTGTVTMTIS